mmetsp:Transcript_138065/g.243511  ORF Transcript_138065/g.243511 Transcript_138065/m.243511 type:complete len:810 (+) Transcript_138065:78-2507(+)
MAFAWGAVSDSAMQPGIQLGAPGPALSSTASTMTRAPNSPGGASTPPLTPRLLQLRLKEAAERVHGVLRDTSDVHNCLAAQDARFSLLTGMFETGAGGAGFNGAQLERLRQQVTELRNQLDKGGSQEPATVQHVQRMLSLLSGYANSVEDSDPAARREFFESIDSLKEEVGQLNDLAARGERAAGEVSEVRRTLEDVSSQIGTPCTPTRMKASSAQEFQDLRQEMTEAIEAVRAQVSEVATAGREMTCVQELRVAVDEVRAQMCELTQGLAEVRSQATEARSDTSMAAVRDSEGAASSGADVAQVKRDLSRSEKEIYRRLKDMQSDFAGLRDEAAQVAASTQRDLAELRQRLAATPARAVPARAVSPRHGTASPRTDALGHEGETLLVLKQLIRNSQRETNDAVDELRSQVQQITACSSEVAMQVAASTQDSACLREELANLAQELRSPGREFLHDGSASFVTAQQLEDALQGLQNGLGASVRRDSQIQLEETAEQLRQQLSVELTSEKCLTATTPENAVTHEQLEASLYSVREEFKKRLDAVKHDYIESSVASMKSSMVDERSARLDLEEELRKQCGSLQQELGTAIADERDSRVALQEELRMRCGSLLQELGSAVEELRASGAALQDELRASGAALQEELAAATKQASNKSDGNGPAEMTAVRKDIKRLFSQVEILKVHMDDAGDEAHSSAGAAAQAVDGKALAEAAECRKDMKRLWTQVDLLKTALEEREGTLQEEVMANILERLGSDVQGCSPQKVQSNGGNVVDDVEVAEPEFASIREGLNKLKRNSQLPPPAIVVHPRADSAA